jgi:hypothetical protein
MIEEYAMLMAIAAQQGRKAEGFNEKFSHFRGDRWDQALWKLPKI